MIGDDQQSALCEKILYLFRYIVQERIQQGATFMIDTLSNMPPLQDNDGDPPNQPMDTDSDKKIDYFAYMEEKSLAPDSNNKRNKQARMKKYKSTKKQKLKIVMKMETINKITLKKEAEKVMSKNESAAPIGRSGEELNDISFFSETHEDQDPSYVAFVQDQQRKLMANELAKLKRAESKSKKRLEDHLEKQTNQHLQTFQIQVKKFRTKEMAHQDSKRGQINQEINRLREEILYRRKLLDEKQSRDLQNGRKLPDWNLISTQFKAKQAEDRRKFDADDIRRKKSSEEKLKLLQQTMQLKRNKRMEDVEKVVQKLLSQLKLQLEHKMRNDLKQHEDIFEEKRVHILRKYRQLLGEENLVSQQSNKKAQNQENDAGFQNDADSEKNEAGELIETPGEGSLMRRNLRQRIWATSPYQLVVEIHNEGVFLCSPDSENKNNNKSSSSYSSLANNDNSKNNDTFIAWGLKSRKFLHSIVTGEVPPEYSSIINKLSSNTTKSNSFSNSSLPAGLIKCMVKDLRTSVQNASNLRSQMSLDLKRKIKNVDLELLGKERLQGLDALKNKEVLYRRSHSEAQKCIRALQKASSESKIALEEMENFRSKTKVYWMSGSSFLK